MKININTIKKLLKDKEFTKTLPEIFSDDLKKFEEKPDCPCHHELYFKILKEANKQIIDYINNKTITTQNVVENQKEEQKIEIEEFSDFLKSLKENPDIRKATFGMGGGIPDFESEIENQEFIDFDGSFEIPNDWIPKNLQIQTSDSDEYTGSSKEYNFKDKIVSLKNNLVKEFPLNLILQNVDYESWNSENKGDWGRGELKNIPNDKLKEKLLNFRGEKFANKIMLFLEQNTLPPIVIFSKNKLVTITDGHGRISVAYGLDLDYLPAVIFEVNFEEANNNT
jgi:hypothetical protein